MARTPGWPPLYITKATPAEVRRGDGSAVCDFIETFCTVSKDGIAARGGDTIVLRPWQRELIGHLYARRSDGKRRWRQALVGLPRKNGKSALGSALALEGLIFGGQGAEVYSAAGDKEQARIVFGEAKRMVQGQPELSELSTVMRDVIDIPGTNSVYRVLAAEAPRLEGLNPTLAVIDELHTHPNDELWNVLTLGSGARLDPMTLAITTAGVMYDSRGQESICYRLYKHGIEVTQGLVDDPTFFFAWWGAPEGADHRDPKVWKAANPGFGDLLDPEDFKSTINSTPEPEFRTKRLNQWVEAKSAWFPVGVWDKVAQPKRSIEDGADVVLGFDGSFNGDTTALVIASVGDDPFLQVGGLWEKPKTATPDWVVPIHEVEDRIRQLCKQYRVREISCDPYRWASTIQTLEAERLPAVAFPQSPQRMIPATARLYEAVTNGEVHHNGDPDLARHVANAVLKVGSAGSQLAKESKSSNRKIDLAVAAVMAFARAQSFEPFETPQIMSLSDFL